MKKLVSVVAATLAFGCASAFADGNFVYTGTDGQPGAASAPAVNGYEYPPVEGVNLGVVEDPAQNFIKGSVVGTWEDGYLQTGDTGQLTQAWLTSERVANTKVSPFDWGYRVDGIFGTKCLQSLGDGGFDAKWGKTGDGYCASIYQAYGELAYGAVSAKVGKFGTIIGYETADASKTKFNTYSYMFMHEPATHSGGLFTLKPADEFQVQVGLVSASNSSFENRRGDTGVLFSAKWKPAEQFSVTYAGGLSQIHSRIDENRTVLCGGYYNTLKGVSVGDQNEYYQSFVATLDLTDRLSYAFESDFGTMEDRANREERYCEYGFANYLYYKLTNELTCCGRYEYFTQKLQDAGKLLGSTSDGEQRIHDASFSLIYKPIENLFIRPEARYDWLELDEKDEGFTGSVACGLTF